jgi:hypothetical protein
VGEERVCPMQMAVLGEVWGYAVLFGLLRHACL